MSVLRIFWRRLPLLKGRRRLVVYALTIAAAAAITSALMVEKSKADPRLSFEILRLALYLKHDKGIALTLNAPRLTRDVSRQLASAQLLSDGLGRVDPRTLEDLEKVQSVVFAALSATLPAVAQSDPLTAAWPDAGKASDLFVSGILPAILRVAPDQWNDWLRAIQSGRFELAACRAQADRAACELRIHGPNGKEVVLVSLWIRQGFIWRLEQVLNIDLLIQAMRSP